MFLHSILSRAIISVSNITGGGDLSVISDTKQHVQHCYPITLPWRPDDQDSEIHDEEEFGEASVGSTPDETNINLADELCLLEATKVACLLLFQLPTYLPLEKQSDVALTEEESQGKSDGFEKGCTLQDLPAGFMGKLLVHKSGIVKMKLGTTLFDVYAGMHCTFDQDVAAIDTKERRCCILEKLTSVLL